MIETYAMQHVFHAGTVWYSAGISLDSVRKEQHLREFGWAYLLRPGEELSQLEIRNSEGHFG